MARRGTGRNSDQIAFDRDFRSIGMDMKDLARVVGESNKLAGDAKRSGMLGGLGGFTLSAARQVAGSIPGIGGALSGAIAGGAAGGPIGAAVGVASAGISASLGAIQDFSDAGRQGRLGAPIGSSRARVKLQGEEAQEDFATSVFGGVDSFLQTLGLPDVFGGDLDEVQRTNRQAQARRKFTKDDAADTVAQMFAGTRATPEVMRAVLANETKKREHTWEVRVQMQKWTEHNNGTDTNTQSGGNK